MKILAEIAKEVNNEQNTSMVWMLTLHKHNWNCLVIDNKMDGNFRR